MLRAQHDEFASAEAPRLFEDVRRLTDAQLTALLPQRPTLQVCVRMRVEFRRVREELRRACVKTLGACAHIYVLGAQDVRRALFCPRAAPDVMERALRGELRRRAQLWLQAQQRVRQEDEMRQRQGAAWRTCARSAPALDRCLCLPPLCSSLHSLLSFTSLALSLSFSLLSQA